ncbi:MAG: arginase [Planctomycetota bacterium JB042]
MNRPIDLYGVPMDLGADRRGVDMGPSAIRIAGLVERLRKLGHEVTDRGNVPCAEMETAVAGDTRAKYEAEIAETCRGLAGRVAESVAGGRVPLVLGGDHSIAMGTVTGLAKVLRERRERLGLIWFDAHGDMNTPGTSPSGNVHGMPLAALLGHGHEVFTDLGGFSPKVDPDNCVLIGIRSLDQREREMVKASGIHVFTMKEIDRLGMAEVVDQAIETASRGTAGIHVSFDLDGLDPQVAPGVGTAIQGGVDYREAHLMMELIADSGRLLGLEMVELNAVLDERNRTAEVAVELILSALGRSIL